MRAGFRNYAYCGYRGIPFSDRREAAFAEQLARHGKTAQVFSALPSEFPDSQIQAVEQRGLE